MPTEEVLEAQLATLATELSKRAARQAIVQAYDEGGSPVPTAVTEARVTRAYRTLLPVADAPFGSLVVNSVQDRLEPSGIRSGDRQVDERLWGVWQDNQMDAEWKLAQRSALVDGRAFALIWPNAVTGQPEISLDDCSQMIVQYRPGSRRHRVAALRRWIDDDGLTYLTLYRPDGIYKFVEAKDQASGRGIGRFDVDGKWLEKRDVPGEAWPMPNPYGVVPVVELAVNRRLRPGSFGYAHGEYEHCTGLIDRINLLTFLGLVVAFSMGFPLRGVIGERIVRDDDGQPIAPFDAHADSLAQLENPDATTFEFKAADRKNLSVFAELDQFAVVTQTPRHYFPLEQGMSNLSADAIRASEGGLHSKSTGHKASLGESGEEILRVSGLMLPEPIRLSPRAEMTWKDHESRSLAERADAASKLKDVLPPAAVAELALNATGEQIARWEAQAASSAIGQLLAAANTPAPVPVP